MVSLVQVGKAKAREASGPSVQVAETDLEPRAKSTSFIGWAAGKEVLLGVYTCLEAPPAFLVGARMAPSASVALTGRSTGSTRETAARNEKNNARVVWGWFPVWNNGTAPLAAKI